MKLELKHIAPYLPYELSIVIGSKTTILKSIHIGGSIETRPTIHGYKYCDLNYFKPILRPLSDLTKEIEHNGEKFVPMDILYNEFSQYDCFEFDNVNILNNPYNQIQNLLEWHFDIYGLIEKNLAIDINTLEK